MGLLDEAIREHLDLKRRRGADPADIERAEREALGPVRRNRDTAAGEPEAVLVNPGEQELVGPAYDEPDEAVAGDLAEEDAFADEDLTASAAAPPGLRFVDERPPFSDDTSAGTSGPPLDDDAPATRIMRAAEIPPPSDRTAEYDVEAALAAEAGDDQDGEDEDVLEETPEFLQDTPDHDRLWFEQRPPRDFDFDG